MYTSVFVQLAPRPSAVHAADTSTKWSTRWLDAHIANARMKASVISVQSTNVTPKLENESIDSAASSLNCGRIVEQSAGSSAYVMPPPRPASSEKSAGCDHAKRFGMSTWPG